MLPDDKTERRIVTDDEFAHLLATCGAIWTKAGVVQLTHPLAHDDDGEPVRGALKTRSSKRNIKVSSELTAELAQLKLSRGDGDNDWVFPRVDGKAGPCSQRALCNAFSKAAQQARLRGDRSVRM